MVPKGFAFETSLRGEPKDFVKQNKKMMRSKVSRKSSLVSRPNDSSADSLNEVQTKKVIIIVIQFVLLRNLLFLETPNKKDEKIYS